MEFYLNFSYFIFGKEREVYLEIVSILAYITIVDLVINVILAGFVVFF